jgi:zinc protease
MKRRMSLIHTRLSSLLVLLCGLALSACAPLAGSPSQADHEAAVSDTRAQQFALRNGMTLIIKPDRRAPTAVQMLWVRVGSMDEVDGHTGVAHALEHMMFKGTPDIPPGEFSRRVAAIGGVDNAFTMRDATAYHTQVPAAQLETIMRMEADRFARNQWPDEEFRREIEVVKEERRLQCDRVSGESLPPSQRRLDERSGGDDARRPARFLQTLVRAGQRGAGGGG